MGIASLRGLSWLNGNGLVIRVLFAFSTFFYLGLKLNAIAFYLVLMPGIIGGLVI
jgi:hypothetical protein